MAKRRAPDPVDVAVGARIKPRRHELGMSQEKLAHAIGLTFQQVQKYEKGTNRVGSSRMSQIAAALEVPAPYFFEGSGGGKQKAAPKDVPSMEHIGSFISSTEGLKLIKAFVKVPKELQKSIVQRVEKIAANEAEGGES